MKTIVLMMAMAGLITMNAYGQAKDCKPVSKKAYKSAPIAAQDEWTKRFIYNNPVQAVEPCYMHRKNNIVVTECPGTFYDNSDIDQLYEFKADKAYMGYFPDRMKEKAEMNGAIAPQSNVIENGKGNIAPANGNACTRNCTPQ